MKPSDIKKARDLLGITQRELAIRAGVSEQSIGRIERGIRVRAETMKALCAEMKLPYTPLNTIEVLGPEILRDDPSSDLMLDGLTQVPNVRYLVRPDEAWKTAFQSQPFTQRVAALGLTSWWRAFVVFSITLVLAIAAIALGVSVLGLTPLVHAAIEANIITLIVVAVTGFKLGYEFRAIRRPDPDGAAGGVVLCEDAILRVQLDGDRLRIVRTELDLHGAQRKRFAYGSFVTYRIEGGSDSAVFHGLPEHPGLNLLIMGPRTRDQVQEIPVPRALAA